jgi:hypothetical protein
MSDGEHQYAAERHRHAEDQGVRLRPAIGIGADRGLQHGRRDLVRQRQQSNLREAQVEVLFQDRVQRR